MRLTLIILITLVAARPLPASSIALAASPYSQDWAVQFGTAGHEGIRSLAVDSVGRYYVGGYRDREVPGPAYATYLQQFESTGILGWLRQPTGPFGQSDVSQAMVILDDRVYFVTGARMNVAPELYSFDAAGDLHSTTIEDFPAFANALSPYSLAADSDGNFVIGGIQSIVGDFNRSPDVFVAKIGKSGQTDWMRTNVFSSSLNGGWLCGHRCSRFDLCRRRIFSARRPA